MLEIHGVSEVLVNLGAKFWPQDVMGGLYIVLAYFNMCLGHWCGLNAIHSLYSSNIY